MKRLLIITALMALSVSSYSEQWQILGTRPMGMGGAFVAVAQGPIAQYWNPGGLVKSSANVSGMEIPVGVNAEFTGNIIKNASQIGDMADTFQATQNTQHRDSSGGKMNAEQMAAFVKTLSLMGGMNEPGKGALVEISGGANFKFSKLALSINNFTSFGLNPYIDTANVGLGAISGDVSSGVLMTGVSVTAPGDTATRDTLSNALTTLGGLSAISSLICGNGTCLTTQNPGITNSQTLANALYNQAVTNGLTPAQITEAANTMSQYAPGVAPILAAANSGNSYANNQSALTVAGASFMEVAAGYAWNIKSRPGLSIGGNIKMINGRTMVNSFRFLQESDTGEAFKMENPKSSWQPGIDVGALWDFNKTGIKSRHPRVGLVIRNINSPKFDTNLGGSYQLKRQARLGFAVNPTRFWTLAADMDLTKNKTVVRGFDSRELSLGTEINVFNRKAFNIPLRAGLIKNMAEKSSKMAYTFGTGINLLFMHLDVSGIVSSESTELDGDKIPTKVGLAGSFGLLF